MGEYDSPPGGISDPRIAAQLFIAQGAVKMRLSSTYHKRGVTKRVQLAAAMALRSSSSEVPGARDHTSRVPA